ncbi:MAG TPA: organomercurial lyase [Paludibaculum sp.]
MSALAEERARIHRAFVETGRPPESSPLWPALADAKWIVLDDAGRLRMAHPFSAVETDFVVTAGARRWFANCAWDALAVMTMVRSIVTGTLVFDTHCGATGKPMRIEANGNGPSPSEARLHFAVPIRDWWKDIAFT